MAASYVRLDRWFSAGVVAITGLVALTWAPMLDASFGNNHEGRVFARLALQMRNFHQMGLVDSHLATNWEPYGTTYAHHPPLATLLSMLTSALPGEVEWQIRLAPYLLGLLCLPAAAWLLRSLGVRRVPALLAIGVLGSSGLFWIYGRIVFDLGPALAMAAVLARLRPDPHPSRRLLAWAFAVCLLGTMAGWLAIAFAAALGVWLLLGRGARDRATQVVAGAMATGVLLTLLFVLSLAGASELGAQTGERTSSGGLGFGEFLALQSDRLATLLGPWGVALLVAGVLAGLVRRETRALTALTGLVAVAWVLVLRDGATVHDYWIYSLLVPYVIGVGVLLDTAYSWLVDWQLSPHRSLVVLPPVAVALVLLAGFGQVVTGDLAERYVTAPVAAGQLAEEVPAAPEQQTAWVVRIGTARWLSYYWDLPARTLTRRDIAEVPEADLVMLNVARFPRAWLDRAVLSEAVARRGSYVLVTGASLRHSLSAAPDDTAPAQP